MPQWNPLRTAREPNNLVTDNEQAQYASRYRSKEQHSGRNDANADADPGQSPDPMCDRRAGYDAADDEN